MIKALCCFPWKIVRYFLLALWALAKGIFSLICILLKAALFILTLGRYPRKKRSAKPLPDPFEFEAIEPMEQEKPAPKERASVTRIGSVLPLEEDSSLRTFTVLNGEGEMYRIDTGAPGPFHGPVWTKILDCYEKKQTLRARLTKALIGKSGHPAGFQVKIGPIEAFMPNYHSLRRELERGINTRIAILNIDPVSQRITASARVAYQMLLGRHHPPQVGEEVEALYWEFDENQVYFLLPGNYVGKAPCDWEKHRLESCMGNLTHCHVESVNKEEREALVTLPGNSYAVEKIEYNTVDIVD